MKIFIMKFMLIVSSLISVINTPMSMGVLLLIQTIMTTFIVSKIMISSWMAMIIFLMLIGGLLILFMYMSSIASNEKFKPNLMLMLMLIIFIIPAEELLMEVQTNDKQLSFTKTEALTLTKIYNKKSMFITLMLFMYLLLTMIVTTMIIKIFKGPLRSK